MTKIILPNVRKLLIPDPGYVIFEADLAGADAQVVAWEAEDEDLKNAFRAGLDVHTKNATDMWGTEFTKLPEKSFARRFKRHSTKVAVHLTNYGGTPRTLAIAQDWTIAEAERFQKRWFNLHPGIKQNFHGRVEAALATSKTVYNKYGFRCVFFDRPEAVFPEALAWIPQSTVAHTTYLGAFNLEDAFPHVEILLQVHDSLVFQFRLSEEPRAEEILEALQVGTPYDDPLTIPWGLARSEMSWGEVR